MKIAYLIGSAALLTLAAPAAAKPGGGHGHGGHGKSAELHHSGHGKSARGVIVSDRYGRLYALNARGVCPPGLMKRGNGCMPPGQAKKLYNVGQRYNRNFGTVWSYNEIPDYLRSQYTFDPYDRYYYRDGYLYQVDPRTLLVQQVISALLR